MPNPMKIQPVNSIGDLETLREPIRADPGKPVFKSLLRKLFDRQFPSVLKNSSTEKSITSAAAAETERFQQWSVIKDVVGGAEFEPSTLCLEKMVQNFIEENNEKQQITSAKCGLKRCNCFNGNSNDSSDDESEGVHDSVSFSSPVDFSDFLKSLINCGSVAERNLLADASRIIEKNKQIKRKDDLRSLVADGLSSAGYDDGDTSSHARHARHAEQTEGQKQNAPHAGPPNESMALRRGSRQKEASRRFPAGEYEL